MIKILIVAIIILLLSGCNSKPKDKFSDFEHHNLSKEYTDFDFNEEKFLFHTYIGEYGSKDNYVIADITPESYETSLYGLFYQVSHDDYILLFKEENSNYLNQAYKFDGNKLYMLESGDSSVFYEYTLDHEKVTKKKIETKYSNYMFFYNIEKITENYIYFNGQIFGKDGEKGNDALYSETEKIKCSLSDYKCEEVVKD